MKEIPILFRTPMVQAILGGTKKQTRRLAIPKSINSILAHGFSDDYIKDPGNRVWLMRDSKFGDVNDILWVKETYGFTRQDDDISGKERVIAYKAGHPYHITQEREDRLLRSANGTLLQPNHHCQAPPKWKPSIFMPRWASRINLVNISVRIERVKSILEEDAIDEGIETRKNSHGDIEYKIYTHPDHWTESPLESFWSLWQTIHGEGSKAQNPMVFVYDFVWVKDLDQTG